MNTKEIQSLVGKDFVLKGQISAENVKYIFGEWEHDVLTISKSGYITELEVKVTRSDFLKEQKAKSKRKKFAVYLDPAEDTGPRKPNRFAYVCPEGLIGLDEIHPKFGLYYVRNNILEVVRKPSILSRYKHDIQKLSNKLLLLFVQRRFLGSALMTYKNKEITDRNKENDQANLFNEEKGS